MGNIKVIGLPDDSVVISGRDFDELVAVADRRSVLELTDQQRKAIQSLSARGGVKIPSVVQVRMPDQFIALVDSSGRITWKEG